MTEGSPIELERLGEGTVRLWLNRPRALNALNGELMLALESRWAALEADPALRVVIIQGRGGKAFSAGADVAEVQAIASRGQGRAFARRGQLIFERLKASRLISLAVVQGYALGGGLELAVACDLRIATRSARLGLPELRLGVIPGFGGTQRLSRLVGEGRALALILTGEAVTADHALAMGLVNWVVDGEDLDREVRRIADGIAGWPASAVSAAKDLVRRADPDPGAGLAREAEAFGRLVNDLEARQRLAAFLARKTR